MEAFVTEIEVREYCKENEYDFDKLIALLDKNEIEHLYDEVRSYKNGAQFLACIIHGAHKFASAPSAHSCAKRFFGNEDLENAEPMVREA